ncbi:hypothetical protein [Solidesulfovibrio magneticus]|uniref:Response regulatory domain-containing protein n=1 Tax=Solidesulfovibrio magneticus (strain ATCC 700980 / DSM 13731 / RS-1) TaxID=573370 RepID=C4XP73_SOLM1|nr:hypothetical protein [Solidesulfovibrio magneticus]BAH77574.1 hypothetical protein DMR_40830 [Solidesulfovibrio magneticus RS-1]
MSRTVVIFSCDPIRGNVTVRKLRRHGFTAGLHARAGDAMAAVAASPPDILIFDTVDALAEELSLFTRSCPALARAGVAALVLGERGATLPLPEGTGEVVLLPGQLDPEELAERVAQAPLRLSRPAAPTAAANAQPAAAKAAAPTPVMVPSKDAPAADSLPSAVADARQLEADLRSFLGLPGDGGQ